MLNGHGNRVVVFTVKAAHAVAEFARNDAKTFLRRYPLLAMTPLSVWGLALARLRAKLPGYVSIAWKLALAFSLLITLALSTLGVLFGLNQARLLEEQTGRLGATIVDQAAQSVKEPLLASDRLSLELIAAHLFEQEMIRGLGIYDDRFKPLVVLGTARSQAFANQITLLARSPRHRGRDGEDGAGMVDFIRAVRHGDLNVGYVAVSLDDSTLDTAKRETVEMVTWITLLMLLVGVATSVFLGKRLTRPINHLMEATRAIAEGRYDYQITERRRDELGVLMESMNAMCKGLLQKEKVEQVFSRYVSPQVANEVLKDLERLENVELGGRRVQASVLFADVVGFTSLSESMDPVEVSALLNLYFSNIAKVVHFCQGHIDKYMGDCAMVVFGVPDANEDHAFHCVACAWMLLTLVVEMNRRRREAGLNTLEFRIGANSGTMLAGNVGSADRMEFTVVGDAVNLASRLSHLAEPGTLVITEEMCRSRGLEDRLGWVAQGSMNVRGKKVPVHILRVLDVEADFRRGALAEIERIVDSHFIGEVA